MLIKRPSGDSGVSIELTPMIDMVFLLLIFFLIASSFHQTEREMKIALPMATASGPISAALKEVIINVNQAGEIWVAGQQMQPDELDALIRERIEINPEQKVSVRGDRDTAYAHVVRVLDLCKGAGITEPFLDTVLTEQAGVSVEPKSRNAARVLSVAAALMVLLAGVAALYFWSAQRRRIYTDADTILQDVDTALVREVLWQPPQELPDHINTLNDDYEPALSSDGRLLFFVRGRSGENADIYYCQRREDGWGKPQPLTEINSPFDDLGPALAQDGSAFYFYSNRPGGHGGYDLWMSRCAGADWLEPVNLGPQVNSFFNDYGPSLTPDARTLIFASNRPRDPVVDGPDAEAWTATDREDLYGNDYDLYSIALTEPLALAQPMRALNTAANEGSPALSPVGDFLYFASDRGGGFGGFDLYRARLLRGELQPAENLGAGVNTAANELDPGLVMSGFGLYFSTDRLARMPEGSAQPDYDLHYAESREVFTELDYSRSALDWPAIWREIAPNLLWILLLLLAMVLLIGLLRSRRYGNLGLLARCLLASVLLHVLLLFLLGFWQVGSVLADAWGHSHRVQVSLRPADAGDALSNQVRGNLTAVALPELVEPRMIRQAASLMLRAQETYVELQVRSEQTTFDNRPRFEVSAREAELLERSELPQTTPRIEVQPIAVDVALPAQPKRQRTAEAHPVVERPVEALTAAQQDQPMSTQAVASAVEVNPQAAARAIDERLAEAPRTTDAQLEVELTAPAAPIELPRGSDQRPPLLEEAPANETETEPRRPHVQAETQQLSGAAAAADEALEYTSVAVVPQRTVDSTPSVPLAAPSAHHEAQLEPASIKPATPNTEVARGAVDLPYLEEARVHREEQASGVTAVVAPAERRDAVVPARLTVQQAPGPAIEPATSAVIEESTMMAQTAPSDTGVPPAEAPDPREFAAPVPSVGALSLPTMEEAAAQIAPAAPTPLPRVELGANRSAAAAQPAPELAADDAGVALDPMTLDSAAVDAHIMQSRSTEASLARPTLLESDPQPLAAAAPAFELPKLEEASGTVVAEGSAAVALAAPAADRATDVLAPAVPAEPQVEIPPAEFSAPIEMLDLAATASAAEAGLLATPELAVSDPFVLAPAALALPLLEERPAESAPESQVADPDIVIDKARAVEDPLGAQLAAATFELTHLEPHAHPRLQPNLLDWLEPRMAESEPPMRIDHAWSITDLALPGAAPVALELPADLPKVADAYAARSREVRQKLVEQLGGSAETERAVAAALQWLAAHQSPDGRWDADGFDDRCGQCGGTTHVEADLALTGLSVLCFLAADHTHLREGPYQDNVARALAWLVDQQRPDGDLRGSETMYSHGIAAIALCEAFGVTQDSRLRRPGELAVQFIYYARNRETGGWRYDPGQAGDTSVFGWQIMALKSAERAGLEIPPDSYAFSSQWLQRVTYRSRPGLYAYRPGRAPTPAMTAEAMFARQLLGVPRDEASMKASASYLQRHLPDWNEDPNTYYWYYATLALFQHRGPAWTAWNEAMTRELLAHQAKSGRVAGSWEPLDRWALVGGRVYQTAMCTMMLESYYRYLPMYSLLEPED